MEILYNMVLKCPHCKKHWQLGLWQVSIIPTHFVVDIEFYLTHMAILLGSICLAEAKYVSMVPMRLRKPMARRIRGTQKSSPGAVLAGRVAGASGSGDHASEHFAEAGRSAWRVHRRQRQDGCLQVWDSSSDGHISVGFIHLFCTVRLLTSRPFSAASAIFPSLISLLLWIRNRHFLLIDGWMVALAHYAATPINFHSNGARNL
jgi:hypothetical protein